MSNYAVLTAVVLAAAFIASGCSKKREAGNTEAVPAISVKGTTLEIVRNVAVPDILDVIGTVRARTSAVVSTRIPGSIGMLLVREGDHVKKGQLLAQLDAQENQATAAAAAAGIDESRRGVDEALARKRLADSTFERFRSLLAEQAVTRQEFDVRQSEKDLAAQGVFRAESRLRQALEGAKAAAKMADYTRIFAPISGIIARKQADLGATVFPGQPLMTIEDDGNYQLELALPENAATVVKPGLPLQVTLDAIGITVAARIAEVVPAADPVSRTFTAKVVLNQKGLKSGMFGRGTIALGSSANSITLPKKAVVERGALTIVWTVDKESRVRMRIVKTGRLTGERIEILAGLSDGDRVVVSGIEKVSEAVKVE